MPARLRAAVLTVALVVFAPVHLTAQPGEVLDPILEQFPVTGDGDTLLLPVCIKGKTYLFALDTGAEVSLYDRSLPLGEPKDTIRLRTSTGVTNVQLFDCPEATLGKLRLQTETPVIGMDLRKFRQVDGQEIYGILGMDVLRHHIVCLDFDAGLVTFLRAADRRSGQPVKLTLERGTLPLVEMNIPGWGPERFLVDTGSIGIGSGDLTADLFTTLAGKKKLATVGSTLTLTLSDNQTQRIGQVERVGLDQFEHAGLLFCASGQNVLGLDYWVRYTVTFDFPGAVMYLKPSKHFTRADQLDRSGLHMVRIDGKTVVEAVDRDSPAEHAGIKPDDIVLKIGGHEADRWRLLTLRRLLCTEGKKVPLILQRGETELGVSVSLKGE